ncbi:methyl-accepting chemotaxis sensory transducer [Crinalium epipsammum PCC 9333]|uniref:Methyl-accepting chemotaxis sensory transducer n=2 Tax=Crinalium TaxID=241421 RepID=K9VSL3_9CYAN|nr:methyl-accepting chemotaxis sensory transducer [Crinalium epipsammum PCC 9333]
MLQKMSLQTRLLGSFMLMGGIVLAVGLVGANGNSRLSKHIDTLGNNTIPSVTGLWKVNEGQTQVQSSERALINPLLSSKKRQVELERVKNAWKQIDEGFKQYESAPRNEEEEKIYQKFLEDWEQWKLDHQKFLQEYQKFANFGIQDPPNRMAELVSQGKQNSPEMRLAKAADTQLDRMSEFSANQALDSFNTATEGVIAVIDYSQELGVNSKNSAEKDVQQTNSLMLLGMIVGPGAAIIFGVFLSRTIAKPLGAKIANIVNTIVSSSSEIAATVDQQERTASQQAVSVSQTSTTMDELGASSRISSEQAESAANGAREVLTLVDGSNHTDHASNYKGSSLREKVTQIAEQILRLSEQTHQIGSISTLVSELANQTNMLALNAAVEAVRAGEHGKGFAVVASEIRKLADQSKKSAERINGLVMDIQNATNSTVMVADEGRKTVENVVDSINTIAVNTQQISLTSKQQAVAIQQVVEAMNNLTQGASQTASGISQTKVGVQRLNDAALNLKAVV